MVDETAPTDPSRRLWLSTASLTGGVGVIAAAVPFVASMAPSERAQALGAPVNVDLGDLGPGELKTVEWRGRPVWILRRTDTMLSRLESNSELLADPQSGRSEQPAHSRNAWRSIKPEIGVMVGICTHLGCIPTFRPTASGSPALGSEWPGGFFCPCHGSKFDLAGRVFKNMPAPTNLEAPPYRFEPEEQLLVGEPT